MECRESESDMAEVPVTILETFTTGFAGAGLTGYSLNGTPQSTTFLLQSS
jgi:hypothetical protein